MKSTNRLVGEQLLRDFAARDAREMRHYEKQMEDCPESTYISAMYYYHRASYKTYKHALQVVSTPAFWWE